MKLSLVLFASIFSFSAFAASDIVLFANINVSDSTTVASTDANGGLAVDTYSSEETYVIGTNSNNGRVNQIVARVEGCKWVVSPKTLKLLISNKSNKYSGMFQKTTYTMAMKSENECKDLQRAMRSATTVNPVKLRLEGNTFTQVTN